ncbi:sigma-70 family RNA polymerase sigma factor [Candidatus Poribacteria bacterium]
MASDTMTKAKAKRFEAAALPYMDSVYRSAYRMVGNESDAQDLVQDTYLRAYRFFDRFKEGTDFRAWLFAIMKNTFINNINRDGRQPQMIHLPDMEKSGMGLQLNTEPEDEIFGKLLNDDIIATIYELPDVFRVVSLLSYVDGFSYEEIAEIIGCPIGTVMSRLHRGRKLLRKKLVSYAA